MLLYNIWKKNQPIDFKSQSKFEIRSAWPFMGLTNSPALFIK